MPSRRDDEFFVLSTKRRMQRDRVRRLETFVEFDLLTPNSTGPFWGQIGIKGDDLRLVRGRSSDQSTDITAPNDTRFCNSPLPL